jgi:polysaccharide chain length determinant protein (PEP-CTERM system associated)
MEHTTFSPLDYVSVITRRKWYWITPLVLSIAAGWLLMKYLPKEYKSQTTIGVTAALVSPTIVGQAAPFDNQERLRALSQQLRSTPLLARVVREEQLAGDADVDRAVSALRGAIDVKVPDPVASTSEPRRLDTFVVTYTDAQPARAQRVADRLGRVFVDENSKTRAARAEDTTAFIDAQLAASAARITDLDTRLRKAKEAFMGQLPEQTAANLSTLAGLRQQVVSDQTAARAERDRLALIDRQLDAIDKNTVDEPGNARTSETTPETRVAVLERELTAARATYTDQHPEVQRIQDELANAKRDAAAVRTQPVADRMARLQRNPAYLQLQGEREMARARTKDIERDTAETQTSIARYQARVEAAPMVEQQLKDLQLGYDLEKQQYTELSNKKRAAAMAASVERGHSGERFDVLDAATFPSSPTTPLPMRVWLGSILAGLIVGAGLTLGREYLDSSIHDERDLRDAFDLPILGSISHLPA